MFVGKIMQSLRRVVCVWAVMCVLVSGLAVAAVAAGPYHGNLQSRIYHNSSCRYYFCKRCTAVFATAQAARAAGYRPCRVCGG